MNVPVYEIKDGEATNGFIKTVTASIKLTNAGVYADVNTVTLRRVSQRYDDRRDDLPCNYKTLDNVTLEKMLHNTEYGRLYVSILGENIMKKVRG